MTTRPGDFCDARHDDLTAITCHRFKGHPGDHEGISVVTWEAENDEDGEDSA